MKKVLFVSLVFVVSVLLGSCTKYSFMSMEEKIVGTWDFEEVIYRRNPFSGTKNITSDYQNLIFTFSSTGDFILMQKSDSLTYTGKWSISTTTTGTETPQTTYSLFISYYNYNYSMVEQIVWEINSIGATRFDATSSLENERWYYTLRRN